MSNACQMGVFLVSKRKPITVSCILTQIESCVCVLVSFVFVSIPQRIGCKITFISPPPLLRVNRCEIGENSVFGHSFTSYDHDLFYFIFYPVLFLPIFGWIGRLGAFIQRTFFTFCFAFKGVNYTFCPHPNLSNPSFP